MKKIWPWLLLLLMLIIICIWTKKDTMHLSSTMNSSTSTHMSLAKQADTHKEYIEYTITQKNDTYILNGKFKDTKQQTLLSDTFQKLHQKLILQNTSSNKTLLGDPAIALTNTIIPHFIANYENGKINYSKQKLSISGKAKSYEAQHEMQRLLNTSTIASQDNSSVTVNKPMYYTLNKKGNTLHLSGIFHDKAQVQQIKSNLPSYASTDFKIDSHYVDTASLPVVEKLLPFFISNYTEGQISYKDELLTLSGMVHNDEELKAVQKLLSQIPMTITNETIVDPIILKRKQEAKLAAEQEAKLAAEQEDKAQQETNKKREEASHPKLKDKGQTVVETKENLTTISKEKISELDTKSQTEAKAKAKLETAKRVQEETKAKLEAKRKTEAEAKAKLETAKRVQEETKAKLEAKRKTEAEAKAKLETAKRVQEETKAKLEAKRKTEAEAKAKLEAEKVQREHKITKKKEKEFKSKMKHLFQLENIEFNVNKSTLTKKGKNTVNKLAKILKQYPSIKIEIAGHTDSDGSKQYNQRLSQSRVDQVKSNLIKQHIAASRLTAKGYGESKPLVPNTSDENKQKNRRVDINIQGE